MKIILLTYFMLFSINLFSQDSLTVTIIKYQYTGDADKPIWPLIISVGDHKSVTHHRGRIEVITDQETFDCIIEFNEKRKEYIMESDDNLNFGTFDVVYSYKNENDRLSFALNSANESRRYFINLLDDLKKEKLDQNAIEGLKLTYIRIRDGNVKLEEIEERWGTVPKEHLK